MTLENRVPTISLIEIRPSTITSIDTATCFTTSSDEDGESLTLAYEWSVSGNIIGTSETLLLDTSLVQPGDALSCAVTATDANGDSDTDSAQSVISNIPPVVDSISISPSNPSGADSITCSATTSDVDGASPTLSFEFSNQTTGDTYTATTTNASERGDLGAKAFDLSRKTRGDK